MKNIKIRERLVSLPPYLDLTDPTCPAPECKNSVRKLSVHTRFLANEEDRKHMNLRPLSIKEFKGGKI